MYKLFIMIPWHFQEPNPLNWTHCAMSSFRLLKMSRLPQMSPFWGDLVPSSLYRNQKRIDLASNGLGRARQKLHLPLAKLMKYQLPISPFKGRSLGFDALKRRGKESGYLRVKIGLISSLHLRAATFRRRWTWRTPLCVDCSFSEQNSGCVAS